MMNVWRVSEMSIGPVYLYLSDHAHAKTWVEGGEIPIFPAQKYKSDFRDGIFTPDENLHQEISGNLGLITNEEDGNIGIGNFIKFPAGHMESIQIQNCEYFDELNSKFMNLNGHAVSLGFDSHILCFSDTLSLSLMHKLNKVCVVKIDEIEALNAHISKAIGENGFLGKVNYTESLNRNLFLKSHQDKWQKEVRIAWPFLGPDTIYVKIPPKTAKHVRFQ